jgi:hypothetical protein
MVPQKWKKVNHQGGGPQAEPHSEDCGLRSETHDRARSHPL